MSKSERVMLEGAVSVGAAITSGSRPVDLIYLARSRRGDAQTQALRRSAKAAGVPIRLLPRAELDRLARGMTHGGVLAAAGPRQMVSLDELVSPRSTGFVVMLDGIEDPYNFGYAMRALYAAGVSGLVVRRRSWSSADSTVVRASAGASELIPMAMADSPQVAARHYKDRGLTVAATAHTGGSRSIYEADLTNPLFMLIGGEKRGIQRSFLDQADLVLSIPYGRSFDRSLGAISAASIVAFEVMRQRRGVEHGA